MIHFFYMYPFAIKWLSLLMWCVQIECRLVVAEDPLEHIVVINLEDDRGKGRREHMIQQFQKVPWCWILFGFAFEVEKHRGPGGWWPVPTKPTKWLPVEMSIWRSTIQETKRWVSSPWIYFTNCLKVNGRNFMGRTIPILEVIIFEVRLSSLRKYWGVWDMLPKLLVGSVVWLIGWFHKRFVIIHPKTNSLPLKPSQAYLIASTGLFTGLLNPTSSATKNHPNRDLSSWFSFPRIKSCHKS